SILFFVHCSGAPRALPSFPTRRSSDLIDGRNIWKADLSAVLRQLEDALERAGAAQLWVAPSCSLLHVPIDLDLETRLDSELKARSEEHTSELQSRGHLVCRLLLEKKKK